MKHVIVLLALLAIVTTAGSAMAQCSLSGEITAGASLDPALPQYVYTLTITWDTGSQHGLSHVDLIIDPLGLTCICPVLDEDIILVQPAGTIIGEGGCTALAQAEVDCSGDPSIPGVDGSLIKFDVLDGETCEADVTGTMVVVFYSDHPPYPIDADALALVDKFAGSHCFGHVTGVFPSLPCDPVPAVMDSWGNVKGHYR